MSDEEAAKQRKRYAKRLAFGYACTCLSAALFLTVVVGMSITFTTAIFDSNGDCVYRVVYGLYFTACILCGYMIIQEWCTYSNIKNDKKRYGCHKMNSHQFFMHCIILMSALTAIVVDALAHPDNNWTRAVAGFAIGLCGVNTILRLALINSQRERDEDMLAKLQGGE